MRYPVFAAVLLLNFPSVSFAGAGFSDARFKSARQAVVDVLRQAFPGESARVLALEAGLPGGNAAVLAVQDPNAKDDDGTTALMRAAKDGHTELVKTLLAQPGIRINEKDPLGHTALMLAAIGGRTETVRLLLDAKADAGITDAQGETALHLAAYYGRTKTAQVLLEAGADANQRDLKGNTVLISAVKGGRTSTVDVIASAKGVDLNAKNPEGATALIEAARSDRDFGIVAVLLARGADKNLAGGYKDYNGRIIADHTPLLVAVLAKNFPAVKALLEMGADANRRDPDGSTALILAISGRSEELALLIAGSKGTDLSAVNNAGTTALILAVQARNFSCVKALIDGKAELNYRDPKGKTALGYAKANWPSKEIVDALVAAGARE